MEVWRLSGLRRPYYRVYVFDLYGRTPRLVRKFFRTRWGAKFFGTLAARRLLRQQAGTAVRAPYQVGTFMERIKL